jgi:hypothetical protein
MRTSKADRAFNSAKEKANATVRSHVAPPALRSIIRSYQPPEKSAVVVLAYNRAGDVYHCTDPVRTVPVFIHLGQIRDGRACTSKMTG